MIKDYIFIARPDHWGKNILVLPGCLFAFLIAGAHFSFSTVLHVVVALMSCCLIASANYAINEWLDAEFDKFHPLKKNRPGASGRLSGTKVWIEYAVLAALGLLLARAISPVFLKVSIFFLFMGLCYNVSPVRTKDRAFLDVVSESVNNPIRFTLGWLACVSDVFPPSSILLAYWAGGAFLMAAKRYAEYRFISDKEQLALYRRSFAQYTEKSLLLFSFFCAILSSFFTAIFLIKYRIEFLVLFPFITVLFIWYFALAMNSDEAARSPEKIFLKKRFFTYVCFMSVLTIFLCFVDLPFLHVLTEPINI